MSDLTSELNLKMAVVNDDTSDYLTSDLRSSLSILDGLFNATTGHTHNGAHQGGALTYQNLLVSGTLTVNGTSDLKGGVTCEQTLQVLGATTVAGLTAGTLHLTGAATLDTSLTVPTLTVATTLTVSGNQTITGTLGVTGVTTLSTLNATAVNVGGIPAATTTGAQTLTNKTLTSPSMSGPTVTDQITVQGGVIRGDGSGQIITNGNLTVMGANVVIGGSSVVLQNVAGDFRVFQLVAYANNDVSLGGGALATNATTGFPSIPRMAGAPTGTPSSHGGGWVPMVYASNRLYIWDGAWRSVLLS